MKNLDEFERTSMVYGSEGTRKIEHNGVPYYVELNFTFRMYLRKINDIDREVLLVPPDLDIKNVTLDLVYELGGDDFYAINWNLSKKNKKLTSLFVAFTPELTDLLASK